jgi:hypothetical protein
LNVLRISKREEKKENTSIGSAAGQEPQADIQADIFQAGKL